MIVSQKNFNNNNKKNESFDTNSILVALAGTQREYKISIYRNFINFIINPI